MACVTKNASLKYTLCEISLEFTSLDPYLLKIHNASEDCKNHREEAKKPANKEEVQAFQYLPG